jgi:hypothetical protein
MSHSNLQDILLEFTTSQSDYESLQSSDDELPEPCETGPATYEKERMYILATIRYLNNKVRQLTSDIDDLIRRK